MSDTCKKLSTVIAVLGLQPQQLDYFLPVTKYIGIVGIVLGTVASLIKVYMLERTLDKAVDMDPKNANNYTRANYTMRLVVSVVIVVLACIVEQINVVGVLIGLLLVQPAAYITNFITANKKNNFFLLINYEIINYERRNMIGTSIIGGQKSCRTFHWMGKTHLLENQMQNLNSRSIEHRWNRSLAYSNCCHYMGDYGGTYNNCSYTQS